jgi:hypothetical protein
MKLTARGRTESNGLGEQALQLREDSRLLIRLKVHPLTTNLAAHKAGSGQLLQLALYGADGSASVPDQLAEVVRFVSVAQEPSKHASPRAAEKERCGVENRSRCSQDGDKRTQNGNGRSTVR